MCDINTHLIRVDFQILLCILHAKALFFVIKKLQNPKTALRSQSTKKKSKT